jgi:alkylated DNA repair dioxygenase AlkB
MCDLDKRVIESMRDLSLPQLDRLVEYLNRERDERRKNSIEEEINANDFVTMVEDFIDDGNVELLLKELENQREKNVWLTKTGLGYGWGSTALVPTGLDEHPVVAALLEKINRDDSFGTNGLELNSCLVTKYCDGQGIGYHTDFEACLDETAPIIVVSVGGSGKVDFRAFEKKGRSAPDLELTPRSGSAYIMRPGCQEKLKHRAKHTGLTEVRYALSFRRRVVPTVSPVSTLAKISAGTQVSQPPSPTPAGDGNLSPSFDQLTPAPSFPVRNQNPRTASTLLLGTSMSKWVKGVPGLVNLSVSGARVVKPHPNWKGTTVMEMLKKRRQDHPDERFEKVIIAFGTNDVRFHGGFVYDHRTKNKVQRELCVLVEDLRKFYGRSVDVVLAEVPPLRPVFDFTVGNVHMFNRIVNCAAHVKRCKVAYWMSNFLTEERLFNESLFSRDGVHLNKYGYALLTDLISIECV